MRLPLMRNNFSKSDIDAIIELLNCDDPRLTNGKHCEEFEQQWSDWLGCKYSVFVNSGSSANLLSMTILKSLFPKGGEIIVPALTWVSDIASVIQTGFTPVFVDVDLKTLSMSDSAIDAAITPKTRAVFLTHAQGFNGLSENLIKRLKLHNIPLIEDVCESHGANFNGRKLGTFGFMSNFSFYYAHHMSTIEGGMVCTNDEDVYEKLRMLRSHGMVRELRGKQIKQNYYETNPELNSDFIFALPGYNLRNNEIGGVLGKSQLKKLDGNILKRNRNHKKLLSSLNKNTYFTDFNLEGSSNYAFNIILKHQNKNMMEQLCKILDDASIEYRRGSAGGGNQVRQPYVKDLNLKIMPESFPNTEHIHFFGLYIGNFPDLADNELDFIVQQLNSLANED